MNERFLQVLALAQDALRNPAANPSVAALVLAAIIVVALIAILFVLLLVTPKKRSVVKVVRRVRRPGEQGRDGVAPEATQAEPVIVEGWTDENDRPADEASLEAEDAVVSRRRTLPRLVSSLLAPVLVALALVAGYVGSGTDAYCTAFCHAENALVVDAVELDHASCTACHEASGVAGLVANPLSRGRMIAAYVAGDRQSESAVVQSRACLRCHRGVLTETIQSERDIRMSHSEPNDAGVNCISCHEQAGHTARRHYSMSSCIVCHNGQAASTQCESCHAADPYTVRSDGSEESTLTVGSGDILYPVAFVGDRSCGGCHNEEADCDTCHGLRMPHDQEFIEGRHARDSAWEKKKMCTKCHTEQWCSSGCHINFPGHAAGWKQEHKSAPRDAGCGCHAARSGRTGPMCVLCHDW